MQPLQYDLRCPAAKENSITHTAGAPTNLDAAIAMRFAKTELQNTIRHQKLQLQNRSRRQRKKTILKHFLNLNTAGSSTAICNHRLANHTTTASTKAAIHNMDAAVTMRSARLNCTLPWRTRPSETEHGPHPSHRRGSQHRRREPICARKHKVSWDS